MYCTLLPTEGFVPLTWGGVDGLVPGCGWVAMVAAAFVLYTDCLAMRTCYIAVGALPYLCPFVCVCVCVFCPRIVTSNGVVVVFVGLVVAGGALCWATWLP